MTASANRLAVAGCVRWPALLFVDSVETVVAKRDLCIQKIVLRV